MVDSFYKKSKLAGYSSRNCVGQPLLAVLRCASELQRGHAEPDSQEWLSHKPLWQVRVRAGVFDKSTKAFHDRGSREELAE